MSVFDSTVKTIANLPAALGAGGGLKIEGIVGGVAVPTKLAPAGMSAELYAEASRTATPALVTQTNAVGARGLMVMVYVSSITNTPNVSPILYFVAGTGTANAGIVWSGAALTATGTYVYIFYPGAVQPTGAVGAHCPKETVAIPIPEKWSLQMNHGDADAITYRVTYSYIL